MANSAICGGSGLNLAQPTNVCEIGIPSKLCFNAQTANDGTSNSILITDTVDDTYVKRMIQTGDKDNVSTTVNDSKRWFPTTNVLEFSNVRAEQNTQEIDNIAYNVSEGNREVSFTITRGATPTLYKAYKSRENLIDSFYSFTNLEQIVGNGRDATKLQPIRIEKGTFKVMYMPASTAENTIAMIKVSFTLSPLEKDEDVAFLAPGDGCIDENLRITDYNGLVDVTMAVDSAVTVTGTTATIDASYIYGSQAMKNPFFGMEAADLTLDGVAVTSVSTTTTDGKYELVFPSLSAGDYVLAMFKESFQAQSITVTIPA